MEYDKRWQIFMTEIKLLFFIMLSVIIIAFNIRRYTVLYKIILKLNFEVKCASLRLSN